MIKKFMLCGKHLHLLSKVDEGVGAEEKLIELYMPLEIFWKIEELIKHSNYMIASSEALVEVRDLYRKIYHTSARYAVKEERKWLYERAKE